MPIGRRVDLGAPSTQEHRAFSAEHGLALSTMGVPPPDLLRLPIEAILDGRAAEMFVGRQLVSTLIRTDDPLYFWVAESATASAELDYLVAAPDGVRPVEVKAGSSGALKSLHQFLWRSATRTGYRLHAGPLAAERHRVRMPDGQLELRLVSMPLYAAELLPTSALGRDRP